MLEKSVDCATLVFQATLPDAREYDVVVAKRAYQIDRRGFVEARPEQELLNFDDHCHEDVNTSSLLYPSDVVPFKPRSDIILAANSYAPSGSPTQWTAGITVTGRKMLHRELVVHGPRQWVPGKLSGGWKMTKSATVDQVPLRWEQAWGGQIIDPSDPNVVHVQEENPLGTGWIDKRLSPKEAPVAAPQLEWPGQPIRDPYAVYDPACFAPMLPAWMPRRALGGTFDQAWMDKQRPFWPNDYDFGYHNAAPRALQVDGYLEGSERLHLTNMIFEAPDWTINLPQTALVARISGRDIAMNMDTLLLDVRSPYPEDWLLTLTWRVVLPAGEGEGVHLREVERSDPVLTSLTPAPTPSDVAVAPLIKEPAE